MPDGWQKTRVEDVCDTVSVGIVVRPAQYYTSPDVGIRTFRSTNVGKNKVINSNWVYLTPEGHRKNSKSALRTGDVLVVRSGAPGTSCVLTTEHDGCNCIDLVFARPNPAAVVPEYLCEFTNSEHGRRQVVENQGGLALKHFNVSAYKNMELLLPPLAEQQRIVEVLRTWDEAIELLEREFSKKTERFVGFRQALLGKGKKSSGDWASAPLSKITKRVQRKSDGGNHPIMTISGRAGYLRQDEKFKRFMAGRSLRNYTLLQKGEFAYNKGNSKTYPQGCIYRLDVDTALVPHVYISFRLIKSLNSDFYAHIFEAGLLNWQLARLINSGIRNDGLLNINAGAFFGCEVPVPPNNEQARIAHILNLAKNELTAIKRAISAVKNQKRGLMQKLLTGEWRVGEMRDERPIEQNVSKEAAT